MRKIVDSSALRSPLLAEFLRASPLNIAVVTDHLTMEMFKGDGQTNIHQSLRILSNHPTQVIVLKSLARILRLRPRRAGLQHRLVNEEQTNGFRRYCRAIFTNAWTPEEVKRDRERKQDSANQKYQRGLGTIESVRQTIDQLKRSYTKDELKALRRKEGMPTELWYRFTDDVLGTSEGYFRERGLPSPTGEELLYSYPFRYALCGIARAVDWIAEGGYTNVLPEKLMNDYTDMGYAAYATFFDGLLTQDEKLKAIHHDATRLLQRVFLKAYRISADSATGPSRT